MPVKIPIKKMLADAAKIRGIATGRFIAELREALKKEAYKLALESWELRQSPNGKQWKTSKSGGGSLVSSGNLRDSLKAENRPKGFILIDRARAKGGKYYSGTHQYGRTIRAKGYDPITYKVFTPQGKVRKWSMRGMYRKAPGTKPLTWRGPDGKWHKAFKIRVPARPMLPKKNSIPPKWDEAFKKIVKAAFDKQLK